MKSKSSCDSTGGLLALLMQPNVNFGNFSQKYERTETIYRLDVFLVLLSLSEYLRLMIFQKVTALLYFCVDYILEPKTSSMEFIIDTIDMCVEL